MNVKMLGRVRNTALIRRERDHEEDHLVIRLHTESGVYEIDATEDGVRKLQEMLDNAPRYDHLYREDDHV